MRPEHKIISNFFQRHSIINGRDLALYGIIVTLERLNVAII
jgi:hypothetical protein